MTPITQTTNSPAGFRPKPVAQRHPTDRPKAGHSLQPLPGNLLQRNVHLIATHPLHPKKLWFPPPGQLFSKNHAKRPEYTAGQRRPDQQYESSVAPVIVSPLYPTHWGHSEALAQLLFFRRNSYVLGRVLDVTVDGNDCVGFFPLPDCPRIPIKFRFQLNSNHRPFLTVRTFNSFFIEGQLQLDPVQLRRYILSHPPGVFLSLRGQNTPPRQIPISLESAAITHMVSNATILTKELQEIVDYLMSLDNKTIIEGKVLHWNQKFGCQAVHKFESKKRHIKFLFDIPESHKGLSIDELKRSFATIRCRLAYDRLDLASYVKETGLCGFRENKSQKTAIAIHGTHVKLIPIAGQ